MAKLSGYGPSLIVFATAMSVLFVGPKAIQQLSHAHTSAQIVQASQRLNSKDNILQEINQAYRDIASLVEPSVVHISAQGVTPEGRVDISSGSGWIYDMDGHIVTNYHVVRDAQRIEVQLHNGTLRDAQLVGADQSTDIAVVKIEPGQLHPAVRADVSEDVNQGDMVFAFGSPFDFRFSMSSGVVSGKGRSAGVIVVDRRATGYENFIQVDAAINPGNSGGPLTNYRGEVIGMNTAIATGRRAQGQPEDGQFAGIGLAIPLEMIVPVVTQLIDTGAVVKGFLGVTVIDIDNGTSILRDLALSGFPRLRMLNVLVARAEGGDLRAGDVIDFIDGQRIATEGDFMRTVTEIEPGTLSDVEVWRFDTDHNAWSRVRVEIPTPLLQSRDALTVMGVGESMRRLLDTQGFVGRGVVISDVVDDSPAKAAGVKRGDIITEVNGVPVSSTAQLRSRISTMLPGMGATLKGWRFDPGANTAGPIELDVTLTQLNTLDVSGELPLNQSRYGIPELGIARMDTCSPQLAERHDVEYLPGVLIEELVPGSKLAEAVVPGSIIVEVGQWQIESVDDLFTRLRSFDLRDGANVTVIAPNGGRRQVSLQVE